jgi:NADP-dependent 3-hydroxy acid dehydrogenase YdfG
MAFAAARCGADVVIASRKYDACVATAEEITAQTGRAAFPHQVHVGHWDELDGLVDAAYDRFGRVDVLVNNAGMSPAVRQADRCHRAAVRRGVQPQPQGPVPAVRAGR